MIKREGRGLTARVWRERKEERRGLWAQAPQAARRVERCPPPHFMASS